MMLRRKKKTTVAADGIDAQGSSMEPQEQEQQMAQPSLGE